MRNNFVLLLVLWGLGSPLPVSAQGTSSQATSSRPSSAPLVRLRPGMVITQSVRITPGLYLLPGSTSPDSAVITVRGNDITVDFNGAVLRGIRAGADPDGARGIGVRIDGGRNVRVVNAHVHGYKIGLLARQTRNLTLTGNDFSHNWKPRLYSVVEHESLADWLSHHHNEKDEWMRFGAGIYLSDVHRGELRDNRIEQGMEGLMMVRTDSLLVWNNTIEYNSGVGIGMYRSSYNRVMHNHASFNVRGFSRYYRRGQDSADLLMYEQSSNNIVAFNSMTHGGDGLFLWAGQTTMDTGAGGANDNIFFANDFSYAPANAIEATFSRNSFVNNKANGSDYGLWGGYSFDTKIIGNRFEDNRTGVAIEHGQNNVMTGNTFARDTVGVYVWANPIEPSDWGYPKHRDTKSRDYDISGNTFTDTRVGLRASGSSNIRFAPNRFTAVDTMVAVKDSTNVVITSADGAPGGTSAAVDAVVPGMPARMAGSLATDRGVLAFTSRNAIVVDEWGPYTWTYPQLWPMDSTRANPIKLLMLGPPGAWSVIRTRGTAPLSRTSGVIAPRNPANPLAVADTLTVKLMPESDNDWSIAVSFRPTAPMTDARGIQYPAGREFTFSYDFFEPIRSWSVSYYVWNDSTDPRKHTDAVDRMKKAGSSLTKNERRLDYMWYSPTIKELPQAKWAAVATTRLRLRAGDYTLRAVSDDGVRVYVDGRLVIDHWKPHESDVGNAPIGGGTHDIRVEYYQVDGWSELRVDIVRGKQNSAGSPGPH